MLDLVRIAAVAADTCPGELTRNLEKIDTWAARAREAGAQLAMFPELSLTGFMPNHPKGEHDSWLRAALQEAQRMAQPIPGRAVEGLIEIARRRGLMIAAGLLEDAGNVLHNAYVLVNGGGLVGVWRKMHVPMYEMPFYNGASAPTVFETSLGQIGANICFDVLLPESTRLLAVQNVEIALFPFAADPPPCTPRGWADWAGLAIRSRCAENGIFGVACNYVGHVQCAGVEQTFPGGGMAVGPRGEVLAEWSADATQPGMMIAELRREMLISARAEPEYLFRFRRPELYGALAE